MTARAVRQVLAAAVVAVAGWCVGRVVAAADPDAVEAVAYRGLWS